MKSDSSSQDHDIIKILKDMGSQKEEYPPELRAARRAAFIDQVGRRSQTNEATEDLTAQEQEVVERLHSLKSFEEKYPPDLLSARRSVFERQIGRAKWLLFWNRLRSGIQYAFTSQTIAPPMPSSINVTRTSFVVAVFFVAVFVGFLIYGNRNPGANLSPTPNGIAQSRPMHATATQEVEVICKPGYEPPLCLAKEINNTQDLTYQGNGFARPAVAKDTLPGYANVHRAAYINDGLYGPGASWVSDSPNSWIKIDLGKPTTINTVTFGRDRLGQLNDGDPGQFVIAVSLSDNFYADGDSSNDSREYTQVYSSEQSGFSGVVSGAQTVKAQFDPLSVRYIKITFENAGTAVDEVEAFMVRPPMQANGSTRTPREKEPQATSTPIPTYTPLPTDTLTPLPTDTPLPTNTATPLPTDTSLPTTATPLPTNTTIPSATVLPESTPIPILVITPISTGTPEILTDP